jgi:hypothetical protein
MSFCWLVFFPAVLDVVTHRSSQFERTRPVTAIKLRKNAIKNNAFSVVFENLTMFGQTTFCVVDCGVFALGKD